MTPRTTTRKPKKSTSTARRSPAKKRPPRRPSFVEFVRRKLGLERLLPKDVKEAILERAKQEAQFMKRQPRPPGG